ncbi:MAG: VWA domain-containing protein [Candidatus Hydrogenedentes bacterium]|nr:VWA domain-containing protein [Candidatus Hydrogenedentota bacterium]
MHHRSIVRALATLVVYLGGDYAARAELVSLDAALGTPVMLAGEKQKAYLRVALTGADLGDASKRAPVNVAFVLDKSGSMQGEKMERAKDATRMAIEKLRDIDIVSIVAYDSTVQVLVPATKLTDRAMVSNAINRLTADNSTALFAGVSKGSAELRKFFDRNRVNRIILLSDGMANVGPSSPGELGDLGMSLGREGIAVTTIGLGLDYNEDLMTKLAMKSDGNHMFAENAVDLDKVFAREFGDVLSVVAQNVKVTINCAEGVRPIRVLGREADVAGRSVSVAMNQLYGSQAKYVILEVEVPGGAKGSQTAVATADVSYLNMRTNAPENVRRVATASFTDSPAIVEASAKKDVMAAAVYQIGVERNIMAMRLRDEGKIDEAARVLTSNVNFLNENFDKYGDVNLKSYSDSNNTAASNLDSSLWNLQRKKMREEQHEIVTQQSFRSRSGTSR